jgi:hypothetical protein
MNYRLQSLLATLNSETVIFPTEEHDPYSVLAGMIKSNQIIKLTLVFPSCCVLSHMVFLMYPSTQQFHNKQINNTVLVFVYCVKVLLHVSTLSGYHQAIIS